MAKKDYCVYILRCENNSYYTGYTNNLLQRYQSHLHGTGKCKYTRSFKPLGIAQAWENIPERSQAMKVEHYIKKLSREQKERLIAYPELLSEEFNL